MNLSHRRKTPNELRNNPTQILSEIIYLLNLIDDSNMGRLLRWSKGHTIIQTGETDHPYILLEVLNKPENKRPSKGTPEPLK